MTKKVAAPSALARPKLKTKKALIIVESPSKAKTIQKYLGRDYIVKASIGHIKDLPKSKLGVDTLKGFTPDYQVIPQKIKVIEELKRAAKLVSVLYLATDPDREGEAIAWHIREELKSRGRKIYRVLFHAITKTHVLEALAHPRELNDDLFHAQQARRILDRLVGYKISPLLWDKVKRGISAGRVQSVALRLVVEREAEIKAFQPEEYWEIEGKFCKHQGASFHAALFKINGQDPLLPRQADTLKLIEQLQTCQFSVLQLEQKERKRHPQPPLITSRLQQEASRKLGYSAKKTMTLAQKLYEGMDLGELGTSGLITYMRTDSVRVEPEAIAAARAWIAKSYGVNFLPAQPHLYKSKKSAQDAHEAIRPTSLEFTPEAIQGHLEPDAWKLYRLIWNRFLASQMMPALYDQTVLDLVSSPFPSNTPTISPPSPSQVFAPPAAQTETDVRCQFRAIGSVLKFPGFTALDHSPATTTTQKNDSQEAAGDDNDDNALQLPANLLVGDPVELQTLEPSQHFTQAKPRFNDASLIRELEEQGIGRPSTYATILSHLQDREYVEKRDHKYFPSELGTVVTELLVASFPNVLNSQFTALMEDRLDEVAEGKAEWRKLLRDFWTPFEKNLVLAQQQMKNVKQQAVATSLLCDQCQHFFVIKWGKLGSFLACSDYPQCKNTQDYTKDEQGALCILPKIFTTKTCKKCQKPMLVKGGKFGKFLACSDYPDCKSTQAITLGIGCPLCPEGEIAQKRSRFNRIFYSCDQWPACHFALWDKPIGKPCPQCHFSVLTEKVTKKSGLMHQCSRKDCGYREIIDPTFGQEKAIS